MKLYHIMKVQMGRGQTSKYTLCTSKLNRA